MRKTEKRLKERPRPPAGIARKNTNDPNNGFQELGKTRTTNEANFRKNMGNETSRPRSAYEQFVDANKERISLAAPPHNKNQPLPRNCLARCPFRRRVAQTCGSVVALK
jgi:hypothetical protein